MLFIGAMTRHRRGAHSQRRYERYLTYHQHDAVPIPMDYDPRNPLSLDFDMGQYGPVRKISEGTPTGYTYAYLEGQAVPEGYDPAMTGVDPRLEGRETALAFRRMRGATAPREGPEKVWSEMACCRQQIPTAGRPSPPAPLQTRVGTHRPPASSLRSSPTSAELPKAPASERPSLVVSLPLHLAAPIVEHLRVNTLLLNGDIRAVCRGRHPLPPTLANHYPPHPEKRR